MPSLEPLTGNVPVPSVCLVVGPRGIVFNTHFRWFPMIKPFKTCCSLGTLSVEVEALLNYPGFHQCLFLDSDGLRLLQVSYGRCFSNISTSQESAESAFLQLHTYVRLNCLPIFTQKSHHSSLDVEADMGFQLSSVKLDIVRLANMQTMPLFLLILWKCSYFFS